MFYTIELQFSSCHFLILPPFPSQCSFPTSAPSLKDKALLSFLMLLYSEELQQELAWVGVTHSALRV